MNKKIITLTFIVILSTSLVFAQDKAPIAENDFYDAFSLRVDTLKVLENDFAYDEHPFKLFQVYPPKHGEMHWDDSLIFYTPNMYFKGVDTLIYRILDTENMMMSDLAIVYLKVENKGYDTLNSNNIHCRINACGVQFWDMDDRPLFEVPANSGLNSLFMQSIWMGGFDEDNMLHFAGDTYRWGTDYFPGPRMDTVDFTTEYDIMWNRVWMLYQTDIDYHRAHFQDEGYEMIENIREWPAILNPELAPFYDVDENGIYNPETGDFPLIKGDQAIYFIFNDDRDIHSQSGGERIGVEIHTMYYSHNKPGDSTLNNTIFASYNIINKSENNYHDYYIGFYNDFDIGCPWDEYLGTDTVLNSFYAYNGWLKDCEFGYPASYGFNPPALSFTALNFDIASTMSFYGWGNMPTMDPTYYPEYYNYMKSLWRDSTHLTYGSQGYGGTEPAAFVYPGNPVTGEGWSEVSANNEMNDRRGTVSTGPIELNAGESIKLDFALVFARAYTGLNMPNLNSVELLKERIADLRSYYDNSLGEKELEFVPMDVEVYPNPFVDVINIKTTNNNTNFKYTIFDILGEMMELGAMQDIHQTQINLESLNNGIYFIRISDGNTYLTRKIIKQ